MQNYYYMLLGSVMFIWQNEKWWKICDKILKVVIKWAFLAE